MALCATDVVDTGAALASSEGIDAVGMRSVAAALGVTPMALYRHVGDADALHAAVVERLLRDLPEVPDGDAWDGRCRRWAHEARAVFGATPGLAHHVLRHWIHLPRVLVVVDGLVAMLTIDGPPGLDAVAGANAVLMHVLMRAQAEEVVRAGGVRRDLATMRSMRADVPFLWQHRAEYGRAQLDRHFTYGLDALLLGLASCADGSGGPDDRA